MLSRFLYAPANRLLFCVSALYLWASPASGQFDIIINVPQDQPSISGGIGSDTQLNVFDGGFVDTLFDAGAIDGTSTNVEVNIFGGIVGIRFDAYHSGVNIYGGEIGNSFDASLGSLVTITGGDFGGNFDASNSTVKISGGNFGDNFDICESILRVSGGTFGKGFFLLQGTRMDMSGGIIGEDFRAFPDSEFHLYGDDFTLDGEAIDGLTPGETFEVLDRGGSVLEGTLLDGSKFSFQLNGSFVSSQDFFSEDSLITITILDEVLTGDVNRDGTVSLQDVIPFVGLLTNGEYQLEADINQDGAVDLSDIAPLVDLLTG